MRESLCEYITKTTGDQKDRMTELNIINTGMNIIEYLVNKSLKSQSLYIKMLKKCENIKHKLIFTIQDKASKSLKYMTNVFNIN